MDTTLQQFADLVRVGDTVLSAARDPLSKIIRIGSGSPYSHGVMITGPDEMTEAYDHALTPTEDDDGIFALSIADYLRRSGLARILVLRPAIVDRGRISEVAGHLRRHSPGFPTVGMACLALCGLSGPALRALPPRLRRRATLHQIRLATDGTRRMHCAETLTRIYLAAGVPLRFRSNRLVHHIEQIDGIGPKSNPADLPTTPRIAQPGRWPGGGDARPTAEHVRYGVRTFRETWQERARSRDPIDMADLVLPGDFLHAEPLRPVALFVRTGDVWRRLAA